MTATLKLLNLYIDESGSSAIYEPRYKFFLISAIVLSPEEEDLTSLLFQKWRNKYLTSPNKCFHATDFFENYIAGYTRNQLRFTRNFNKAVDELSDMLDYLDIKGEVYFVDMQALRKKLRLNEPHAYKNIFSNTEEQKIYRENQEAYKSTVLKTIGKKKIFLPLALTLKNAFSFHFGKINIAQVDNPNKGYIHFESLSGADRLLIEQYHKLRDKVSPSYKGKIIGINFHTKNSLDGGIELADLISYISFQTLRFKHRRVNEYKNLAIRSIIQVKRLRKSIREKAKIKVVDVTNDTF